MAVPLLNLSRESDAEECPDCGSQCADGFVDGHRQFVHGVPNRNQHTEGGDDSGNWITNGLAGFGVLVGLAVDVALTNALTDGGRTLLFIEAHGEIARVVLFVVTASLLLPVAIGVSYVVVVVLGLLLAGVIRVCQLLVRHGEVPFHKRGSFTCVVKKKRISARYELAATKDGIKWRFWPQGKGGAELQFMDVDLFAHEAGPAIEAALALPDELRTYRARPKAEAEAEAG
jgi:hypothetical protein